MQQDSNLSATSHLTLIRFELVPPVKRQPQRDSNEGLAEQRHEEAVGGYGAGVLGRAEEFKEEPGLFY